MDILGILDVPLWAIMIVAMVILLYIYGTMPHHVWTKLGIPGPKPKPFVGNGDVISRLGMGEAFTRWKKQYGNVIGCYLMRRPMLVVYDIKMLKQLLVSDFNSFSHRGFIIPRDFLDHVSSGSLLFVEGEDWKRIRKLLTPIFTTGRLREKGPLINKASSKLVKRLQDAVASGGTVDARKMYSEYTMDVVLCTLFSVMPDQQQELAKLIISHVENFVRPSTFRLNLYFLAMAFPFLSSFFGYIANDSRQACKFYTEFVRQSMEARKNSNETFRDFVQNMINAEIGDPNDPHKKMTFPEIVSQSHVFFLAGNDASSNALMFLSHNLAHNQEAQEKCYQDIMEHLGEDENPTYDNVQKMQYLNACILETLRMYPATAAFNRKCTETTVINGYTIPAGTGIYIPLKTICSDPENYPDPEKFNPNRFVKGHPEESDLPFFPFGMGPRTCIGMRLGLYHVAMGMAATLKHVKFVGTNSFTVPGSVMIGIPPVDDIVKLKVEVRE